MEITKELLIETISEALVEYDVELTEAEQEELGNELMKEFEARHPNPLTSEEFSKIFAEFIARFLPKINKKLTKSDEEYQLKINPKLEFIMDMECIFDKYNEGLTETLMQLKRENEELKLFNYKLVMVNKLFMGKNWTEEEKLKILQQFDVVETEEETKKLYEQIIKNNN